MLHVFVLFNFYWWSLTGVFGVETSETMSVMEGDSITLQSNVTIRNNDYILWNFGAEKSLIAQISIEGQTFSTFVPDGRFRDRLKLDNNTVSLTITNTTTKDAGVYKLEIDGAKITLKTFNVHVYARLPVPVIIRNCSSSSSPSSCSVVCSVVNVSHVTLSWLQGNSLLSSISVSDLSISLSLPLEVEDHDNNSYICEIKNSVTHQITHLDISGVCQTCPDQGLPVFHIVLISTAGSLLIVAALVIFCIFKKGRKTVQTQEEDRAQPALCKPKPRKKKSKQPIYENFSKK